MSNYLSDKKNRDSKTGKKLINALKTWLDNDNLLLWEYSSQSRKLNKYIIELFLCDDELKKSFANACARTIKHLIDKDAEQWRWNLWYCQSELEEVKTTSKSFLDKFGVVLENYDFSKEAYKTHEKNIAWLILWIFLFLVCIAAMTGIYIVMPFLISNLISKYICLLVFIPMLATALKGTERIRSIIDDRIYNAQLDIYKSSTKDEAKNTLYWDMSKIDKVKQCLNLKFPDNNANKNPRDI